MRMQPVVGVIDGPAALTMEQKLWLAHQQIDNKVAPVDLAKSHGLSRKVVRKYALRVKNGAKMYMRDGRPSVIDQSLLAKMVQRVVSSGVSTIENVKTIVREEYQNFALQNSITVITKGKSVPKLLCSRTLMRYVHKVRSMALGPI